jgi:hypothetical protein
MEMFRMLGRFHSATTVGKELPMEQISARFVGQSFIDLVDLPDPCKKAGVIVTGPAMQEISVN